jgi:hypothetical protein
MGAFPVSVRSALGLAAIAAFVLPLIASPVLAADAPSRIIVGIDLSQSNPLTENEAFALKVGQRVAAAISDLGPASEVYVRTLGSYGDATNTFAYDAVISVRQRPETVAAEVERLISGTPLLIQRGAWQAQMHTNILAFLDNAVHSFGCTDMQTHIVIASDGLEDSEYTRLSRSGATLPPPSPETFAGCASLQILGLGQGQNSPQKTIELRDTWQEWADAAGFESFSGLNDW